MCKNRVFLHKTPVFYDFQRALYISYMLYVCICALSDLMIFTHIHTLKITLFERHIHKYLCDLCAFINNLFYFNLSTVNNVNIITK